jgi:dihydrofolate reductase
VKPAYALIAAMSKNGVIGQGDQIPWHAEGEQALFKKITLGATVIMGRKTFDSIGRALPKRNNLVITRSPQRNVPGIVFLSSIEAALAHAAKLGAPIFIIGGGEIYKRTIDSAAALHLTTIEITVDGDVYFPDFDIDRFNLVDTQHFETNLAYSYRHYIVKPEKEMV